MTARVFAILKGLSRLPAFTVQYTTEGLLSVVSHQEALSSVLSTTLELYSEGHITANIPVQRLFTPTGVSYLQCIT